MEVGIVFFAVVCVIILVGLHFRSRRRISQLEAELQQRESETATRIRFELEKAVSGLTHRFQEWLDVVPDGIIVLDADWRVVHLNKAAMQILELEPEAMGKRLIEVLRWSELVEFLGRLDRSNPSAELEVCSPFRPDKWLRVNVTYLPGEGAGNECEFVVVVRDITSTRKLEKQVNEFLARASHELRTPVSNLKGALETLLIHHGQLAPEQQRRFLESAFRNAGRIEMLIRDLLELSVLEAGVPMKRECVDLQSVVGRVVDEFRGRALEKSIELLVAVPSVEIWGDPLRIEQVFINLLDNAIKYGRHGGRVEVGAQIRDLEVEVYVSDDGPGIPKEALPRIFEKFYRCDSSRSRASGGVGLGLAIVKHIVLMHGGRIWAESSPGAGTTVRFTLPLLQKQGRNSSFEGDSAK